jgi:hypothetical protein
LSDTGEGRTVEHNVDPVQCIPYVIGVSHIPMNAFDRRVNVMGKASTGAMNLRVKQVDYSNGMAVGDKQI